MIYSDYRILCASSTDKLEKLVNEWINKGYVPVGGLVVYELDLYQAVAKFMFHDTPA